jgi:hypothetical protein
MPRCKKGEHKVSTTNGRSVCKKKKEKRKKKERKAMKTRPNEGPARVSGRGRGVRTGQPLTRPGYRSAEGRTVMANGVPTNLINKADHEYQLKQAFDRGMNTVDLTRSSTSFMDRNATFAAKVKQEAPVMYPSAFFTPGVNQERRSGARKARNRSAARGGSSQWYQNTRGTVPYNPGFAFDAGGGSPTASNVSPPPPSSPVARRTSRRGAQKPAGTYRVARPYTTGNDLLSAAASHSAARGSSWQLTQAGITPAKQVQAAGTSQQRRAFGVGAIVQSLNANRSSPVHQALALAAAQRSAT